MPWRQLVSATPYLTLLLRRYLHIQLTATQAATVQSAADAGAQAAYGYIATNAGSYRNPTIRSAALAWGVQHVIASAPQALAALGITEDHVRRMVEARFGGLLSGRSDGFDRRAAAAQDTGNRLTSTDNLETSICDPPSSRLSARAGCP